VRFDPQILHRWTQINIIAHTVCENRRLSADIIFGCGYAALGLLAVWGFFLCGMNRALFTTKRAAKFAEFEREIVLKIIEKRG